MAEELRIEEVAISSLSFADYNPRRMMRAQAEALQRSLAEYGPVEPAVINKDSTIIGGHMRVAAAREMGWESFPVIRVDITERKAKLLNLALNKISGEWDEDKLSELLWDLNSESTDDLLELSGFEAPELEKLLGDVGGEQAEPPVPNEAPRRVERGDVWKIGAHFIGCGDSADAAALDRLTIEAKVETFDLIFTSPPYNVGMEYSEHDDRPTDWPSYSSFLQRVLGPWLDFLGQGRAVGWQIGDAPSVYPHRQLAMLEDEMGLRYFRTMIWDKVGIGVPLWYMTERERKARYFTPDYQHELIYLLAKGDLEVGGELDHLDSGVSHSLVRVASATATRDVPDAAGERSRYVALDRHANKVHQAVYPAKLVQGFATHLTAPGECIADPFLGVGSTLIACERAQRTGIGMELDPAYCDVALTRIEQAFEIEAERVHRKRKSRAKAKAAASA